MSRLTRRNFIEAGAGAIAAASFSPLFAEGLPHRQLSKSTLISEPYVVVDTISGKIRGGHSRGALAFKGIPYGGSVSGTNRFKPASPVTPWSGIRDVLALGTPAPQSHSTVYGEKEPMPGEECLVLNVWTPAADGRKRPVLFYNHGGGFRTGSAGSTAQDGGQLAANHDVVVVASNHRLGIMGYLCLDEIGGEEYAGSGNAGMLDIVLALKWVHENIAAFGGDPHNVTIFGESGGGAKTSTLMAMPSAAGFFHKACVMSGPALRVTPKQEANITARAVIAALGIHPDELHRLVEVPLNQLLALQDHHGPDGKSVDIPGGFGPMLDGKFISQHPFDPSPAPYVKNIPLLIGINRDEAAFFYWDDPSMYKLDDAELLKRLRPDFGDDTQAVIDVYRKNRPNATPTELMIAIGTWAGMGADSVKEAERKLAQHGAPVYMYRYDYESNYPIKGTTWTLRAGHATEIAAKFENGDLNTLLGTKPDRFEAAKSLGEVMTSFARTGHPHAPGLSHWPAYDLKKRATGLINVHCSIADDPNKEEREFMAQILAKRA